MYLFLAQGLTLGFAAASSPGPFQAYLLSQAVQTGWRRSWPMAFAPLLSDGPIIILMVLVLAQAPDWLMRALRFAGGLFLLYLAKGAFDAFRRPRATIVVEAVEDHGLLKAVMMNALSPGPYLFWGTIAGPVLLAGWNQSPADGLAFLFGFYAAMAATLLVLIAVFASAVWLGPKVTRSLTLVSAIALLAFGVYQTWVGLTG